MDTKTWDYAKILEVASKSPLGLVCLVVSLVFIVLIKKKNMPRWWPALSITLASIALVGGLFIAWKEAEIKFVTEHKGNGISAGGDITANDGSIISNGPVTQPGIAGNNKSSDDKSDDARDEKTSKNSSISAEANITARNGSIISNGAVSNVAPNTSVTKDKNSQ